MKTPLQAVVCVICDALCDLPVDDQRRAIEAVCVTLGTVTAPTSAISPMLMDLIASLRPDQLASLQRVLDFGQLAVINDLANQLMSPATVAPPNVGDVA